MRRIKAENIKYVYGEGTVGRLGQMTTEYGDGYVYSIEQDISTSGTNSMVFMENRKNGFAD